MPQLPEDVIWKYIFLFWKTWLFFSDVTPVHDQHFNSFWQSLTIHMSCKSTSLTLQTNLAHQPWIAGWCPLSAHEECRKIQMLDLGPVYREINGDKQFLLWPSFVHSFWYIGTNSTLPPNYPLQMILSLWRRNEQVKLMWTPKLCLVSSKVIEFIHNKPPLIRQSK